MKVLILGGNRFFGKRLVQRLLDSGDEVTLLNRGQQQDPFGPQVGRIVMDRKSLSRFTPELEGKYWDIIYDQISYDASDAKQACEVFQDRVGHYVFTSSQSVYNEGALLSEAYFDPFNYNYDKEVRTEDNYPEGKRQAESIFFKNKTFPLSAVRFPIVIGPDDYTGRFQFHIDHIKSGQPMYFPDVNAKISFVTSEDAALCLEHIGKGPRRGPINCCSTQPVVLREFLETLKQYHGGEIKVSQEKEMGDPSPYGIDSDWFMSTNKLFESGLILPEIKQWIEKASKAG